MARYRLMIRYWKWPTLFRTLKYFSDRAVRLGEIPYRKRLSNDQLQVPTEEMASRDYGEYLKTIGID